LSSHQADILSFNYGRAAGLLYLLIIVFGISSELLVRANLVVADDPAATAANILAAPGLFRFGFVADVVMLLSDVAIAVLFYLLLRPVSNTLAMLAAAFRLTQAAVLGMNLLNYFAALLLLNGSLGGGTFTIEQLNTLALWFLQLHGYGYDLGLIFFGLSSLLLGYLLVRADYFPSLLGYGLMAAALVYLAGSMSRFLFPAYLPLIEPAYIVPLIAELAFCLWLLVKGSRGRA
jgi:hypothetical protein